MSNSTDLTFGNFDKLMEELRHPSAKGALVRLRPDGRGEVVTTGIYFANGTAIDPQEQAVYVLQSSQNNCVRIAMHKDGSHGSPEVFGETWEHCPMAWPLMPRGILLLPYPW